MWHNILLQSDTMENQLRALLPGINIRFDGKRVMHVAMKTDLCVCIDTYNQYWRCACNHIVEGCNINITVFPNRKANDT